MNLIKVSDQIALFLKENNIEVVFGIIGAGVAHIFDSIDKLGYTQIVSVHHEQAAVMAMGTYYRTSGKISASIVTTGAGSTNAVTGVVSCWMDSIPGIIISGNEKSIFTTVENDLRIWGVQGYDSVAMVEKVTKSAKRITDGALVYKELELSVHTALEGRKGPIWLDIPMDTQTQMVEMSEPSISNKTDVALDNSIERHTLENIGELLKNAKRPVLWLGHGIRLAGAECHLTELLDVLQVPALVSWQGIDMVDSNHPMVFGRAGVYGQRYSNFIVQNSDLVICIGTRMAFPQVGYDINEFAREAKLIAVDIDGDELKKFSEFLTMSIQADAGDFVRSLISYFKKTKFDQDSKVEWYEKCVQYKHNFPVVAEEHADTNGFMNSYQFMQRMNKHIAENEIIVTDMGTALLSGHQVLDIKPPQRLMTSTGLGEMGFGLPGAIGASFGANKQQVLCLNCDGGMMMNLQEMQTVIHHELPIKIVIFNNDGYLMIKNSQKNLFDGRYSCSDKKSGVTCPDYNKLGKAFGFETYKLHNWDDFEQYFQAFLDFPSAAICEVFMDPEQPCIPKLGVAIKDDGTMVSPPLEDLTPLISRERFLEAMLIKPLDKSLEL